MRKFFPLMHLSPRKWGEIFIAAMSQLESNTAQRLRLPPLSRLRKIQST
jgi:hypothetical protein